MKIRQGSFLLDKILQYINCLNLFQFFLVILYVSKQKFEAFNFKNKKSPWTDYARPQWYCLFVKYSKTNSNKNSKFKMNVFLIILHQLSQYNYQKIIENKIQFNKKLFMFFKKTMYCHHLIWKKREAHKAFHELSQSCIV